MEVDLSQFFGWDWFEFQVCPTPKHGESRLEGVGGQPVEGVVGHVGHEDWDGIEGQRLKELTAPDWHQAGSPTQLNVYYLEAEAFC